MAYNLTPDSATQLVGTTITFTVTRSGSFPAETIYYSTLFDTASAAGGDYDPLVSQPLVFSSGQTTATFTGETASGWQQVSLATPVAIAANTTYVASYYTASGFYSSTRPYFTTSVYTPPLRALADGDGGGNGVYRYGTGGGFPTSTFNSTNYWVDVIFMIP